MWLSHFIHLSAVHWEFLLMPKSLHYQLDFTILVGVILHLIELSIFIFLISSVFFVNFKSFAIVFLGEGTVHC